jgi:hypothetical protein
MAALFPDEGLLVLAKYLTHFSANADVKCHLYANNYTPVGGSVLANFTETAMANYAVQTLTGANWTFATVSNVVTASYPQLTYVFTAGGETVFGYYVTDNAVTKVLWAEKFATSYTPPGGGGALNLTINLSDLLC